MKTRRFLRAAVLCAATLLAVGCGNSSPVGVDSRNPAANPDLIGSPALLQCTPMDSASTTQTIGPLGGTIVVGPHQLTIPPGALPHPVTITATAPSDSVNRVHFDPEGLTFLRSASLTMSYANCNLLGLTLPRQIAYTTDLLSILYYITSLDDPSTGTVTGQLDHFSQYAVAW